MTPKAGQSIFFVAMIELLLHRNKILPERTQDGGLRIQPVSLT